MSIHPYVRTILHDAGLNQLQISKQPKVSRYWVQNAIKKYKQLNRFDNLKRSGHRKKLSGREIHHLRLVKGVLWLSASKRAADLNVSLPEPVTTRTIRRHLKDLAFECAVRIKKYSDSVLIVHNGVLSDVSSI